MKFYQRKLYHVYNRGNNRENIFFERKNYLFFLRKMRSYLLPHCHILAWCLMPNHFHWMFKVKDDYNPKTNSGFSEHKKLVVEPLNRSIATLLSSYTKAINNMYNRTGSLFQHRTKSKDLSPDEKACDNYPLICFLYIHQNPLRAGFVSNLEDWEFSSYRDYAGCRRGSICKSDYAFQLLDLPSKQENFVLFSQKTIPDHFVEKIM